jgi:hypothetical protein
MHLRFPSAIAINISVQGPVADCEMKEMEVSQIRKPCFVSVS